MNVPEPTRKEGSRIDQHFDKSPLTNKQLIAILDQQVEINANLLTGARARLTATEARRLELMNQGYASAVDFVKRLLEGTYSVGD